METLTRDLLAPEEPTSRTRHELRYGSRGSLSVVISGPKAGSWFDHETGEGGDALALIKRVRRLSTVAAMAEAGKWLGGGSLAAAEPRQPQKAATASPTRSTADIAARVWREAEGVDTGPVRTYLAARGLLLPAETPIRFHPRCPREKSHAPAMVALMTDPVDGRPCGVHRTFLAPDFSRKADGASPKAMLGNAGVIRLVPDEEISLGLGLAEGIETALSVAQGFGWTAVWAATSAGGIARFPLLAGIETLTIFADADDGGAGLKAAETCAERWRTANREADIYAAPEGEDLNDTLRRIA